MEKKLAAFLKLKKKRESIVLIETQDMVIYELLIFICFFFSF